MNIYNKYPKGSEWRKWDLHAHTPIDHEWINKPSLDTEEKKRDFSRRYIDFASKQGLSLIAITDHNLCNNLDDLLIPYIQEEAQKHDITILPGFEITAKDGSGIHLLIIFPELTDCSHIKNIVDQLFLPNQLKFTNSGVVASCKSIDEIKKIVDDSKLDSIFIFAHADRENGVLDKGTITGQRRIEEWHKEFIKICQISKSPNDIRDNTFINKVIKGTDANYRKDMTYIIASDCRTIDVNHNSEERFCLGEKYIWVKADPTFEGLKQIIYEEDKRLYIGQEPPAKLDKSKIIESLKISNSNKWFSANDYFFNADQISIIGGKGTGKTALLDLIAFATGSFDPGDSKSFISRALKELNGTSVKIKWADGKEDTKQISNTISKPLPLNKQKVHYLTQSFVEKLCEHDQTKELRTQIENVIFQNIAKTEKSSHLTFEDFKKSKLSVIDSNKLKIKNAIIKLNDQIYRISEKINTKSNIENDVDAITKDLKKFGKQLTDLKSKQGKTDIKRIESLEKLNEEKNNIEENVSLLNENISTKQQVIFDINEFIEKSNEFVDTLKENLNDIKLSKKIIDKIELKLLPDTLILELNALEKQIKKDIVIKNKSLTKVETKIKELTSKLKLEESRQAKLKEINKFISENTKKLEALKKELLLIQKYERELPDSIIKRKELLCEFFYFLFEEKAALTKIYSPIAETVVNPGDESGGLFQFDVKFEFDIKYMSEKGENIIDHTKAGRFHKTQTAKVIEECLKVNPLNTDFDFIVKKEHNKKENFLKINQKPIITYFKNLEELFHKDDKGNQIQIKDQLKKNYTEKEFYDWLMATDYYQMNYSIKFNNTDLEKLSPGLKGVALLILFLELDKENLRPLLIDQPEENLDNRSVYETLRRYFLDAKKRRQIFIVTHNPNLVVNTDSEQIFVSNFSQNKDIQKTFISHVTGSLEHTLKNDNAAFYLEKKGVREHICHILEGGEQAFKNRERKYRIKNTNS